MGLSPAKSRGPLSSRSYFPQPAGPPPFAMTQCQALDRPLAGGTEGQQVEQRPENPQREIEQRAGEHDRAAAEQLDDRAGFGALRLGEAGELRDILRMLGDLQDVERAAPAGARLNPSEIADELGEPLARLHLEQAQKGGADVSAPARHFRDRESGPGRRREG